MASTAATANKTGAPKQAKPASNIADLQLYLKITSDLINQHFPYLRTAPDILYVCMAIWGLESGWKLWHKKGSVIDSSHLSPVDPNKSTLIGTGYYKSDPIRSFVNRPNITPEEKTNVAQGFVAHGLSACMGCYHVRGTPNSKEAFGPYKNVVESLGLTVNPGESITALFPQNELGYTRSIASGLIILEGKYKLGLKFRNNNPTRAIEAAVGYYVGKAGAKDINGYSPEQRQKEVMYTPSGRLSVLASIGLERTGKIGADLTPEMIAAAKDRPPASNTVQNDQTKVASTSGTPSKPVGCQT